MKSKKVLGAVKSKKEVLGAKDLGNGCGKAAFCHVCKHTVEEGEVRVMRCMTTEGAKGGKVLERKSVESTKGPVTVARLILARALVKEATVGRREGSNRRRGKGVVRGILTRGEQGSADCVYVFWCEVSNRELCYNWWKAVARLSSS